MSMTQEKMYMNVDDVCAVLGVSKVFAYKIMKGYNESFLETVDDKPEAKMAFQFLYWTGMRIGELLALNPKDVDLEKRTISITKSYQRLGKKDVITPPKTPKSKRVITIPEFLAADIKDYMDSLYDLQEDDRLFPITKYYLEHEMQRGIKESGVKRIRVIICLRLSVVTQQYNIYSKTAIFLKKVVVSRT